MFSRCEDLRDKFLYEVCGMSTLYQLTYFIVKIEFFDGKSIFAINTCIFFIY